MELDRKIGIDLFGLAAPRLQLWGETELLVEARCRFQAALSANPGDGAPLAYLALCSRLIGESDAIAEEYERRARRLAPGLIESICRRNPLINVLVARRTYPRSQTEDPASTPENTPHP